MTSTNLRGYSILSESKIVIFQDNQANFNNSKFYFDKKFEATCNIRFETDEEADVFLEIDNDNKIYLGTTSHQLFLNSTVPLSQPFFHYLKPESYLCINNKKPVKVIYDALIIDKAVLEEVKENKLASLSLYNFKDNELYAYKSLEEIHKTIKVEIKY